MNRMRFHSGSFRPRARTSPSWEPGAGYDCAVVLRRRNLSRERILVPYTPENANSVRAFCKANDVRQVRRRAFQGAVAPCLLSPALPVIGVPAAACLPLPGCKGGQAAHGTQKLIVRAGLNRTSAGACAYQDSIVNRRGSATPLGGRPSQSGQTFQVPPDRLGDIHARVGILAPDDGQCLIVTGRQQW